MNAKYQGVHRLSFFFDLIQGFLLNYRDIPHGCFLVCELLCCGGRSNIEAMEIKMILLENLAYHTRLHCLTVNLIFLP